MNRDSIILAIAAGVVLLLTVVTWAKDGQSEWKKYQSEFIEIASDRLTEEQISGIQLGIRQIWNPELNVTDRCVSCHLAIDVPGFEDKPHPHRTHPEIDFWMQNHPFEEYGCTSCHSGQGYAVTVADAHGRVPHWERPLLDQATAEAHGFSSAAQAMEINCNLCHRLDHHTDRMPMASMAKRLLSERGCVACHVMDGKDGGSIGPDLTYIGDTHAENYSMSNVEGPDTLLQWHFEHFLEPARVSPGSVMPPLAFSDEEAQSLSLLMMSWRRSQLPMRYVPDPNRSAAQRQSEDEGAP